MSKFNNYVRILLETVKWKANKNITNTEDTELPLDFINALDKTAKEFGYEATGWGEAEELGNRVIMFHKVEG